MKILNYDVEDKQSGYKQKVPFMPDRCFTMLVCGLSGSGETNLLDMIYKVSQKFVPLISCAITFDQNFIFT